jgi:hypothetical protein
MYKTLFLIIITLVTFVLSGCISFQMKSDLREIETKLERKYIESRSELGDIHKANNIKYVSAGKTVILQAALASLMELGFHINNQDIALGVLSGTVDKSSSFMDADFLREDLKYREKLINIIRRQYSDTFAGDNLAKVTASGFNSKLKSISVNVMVIERNNDCQVSVKITYATFKDKGSNYLRDDWVQHGMITGVVPEYTLPPTILRIAYKRVWDSIEKQLFLQNIILNR